MTTFYLWWPQRLLPMDEITGDWYLYIDNTLKKQNRESTKGVFEVINYEGPQLEMMKITLFIWIFDTRTPGSVPHCGTCLCSNCWDQIPRTCHVFTRLFTSNKMFVIKSFVNLLTKDLITNKIYTTLFHECTFPSSPIGLNRGWAIKYNAIATSDDVIGGRYNGGLVLRQIYL